MLRRRDCSISSLRASIPLDLALAKGEICSNLFHLLVLPVCLVRLGNPTANAFLVIPQARRLADSGQDEHAAFGEEPLYTGILGEITRNGCRI